MRKVNMYEHISQITRYMDVHGIAPSRGVCTSGAPPTLLTTLPSAAKGRPRFVVLIT